MKRLTLLSVVFALASVAPVGAAIAQGPTPAVTTSSLAVGPAVQYQTYRLHSVSEMSIAPTPAIRAPNIPQGSRGHPLELVGLLVGFAIMGYTSNATKSYDRDQFFASRAVVDMANRLQYDQWYILRNRIGTVVATVAKGTGLIKPKTTNATTYIRGGVPRAQLGASDDFWDLTTAAQGVGVVPASSFIKYRLIITAAEAAKVQSSTIGVAAAGADCSFGTAPMADGDLILGQVMIATDATHTFTPGTTHLDAAGITATYLDGSDGSELQSAQFTF